MQSLSKVVIDKVSMYSDDKTPSIESLVEEHTVLVKRIAHHMMGRMPANVAVDDLIQSGMIGLIDAIQKFDHGKGASFETYAGIRIRGAMIDELRRGEWAPRSVHRNARRIQQAIKAIENRTGGEASDLQIADELEVSLDEYYSMSQDSMATRLFSMDELVAPDEQILQTDDERELANPFTDIQKSSLKKHLVKAITELPEREQMVLALYYDEELNLREIGEVLGVSESRVSQIHSQAAHRLRAHLQDWV